MRLVYEDEDEGLTWAGYDTIRAEEDGEVVFEMHMDPEQSQPLLQEVAQGALNRLLGTLEEYR